MNSSLLKFLKMKMTMARPEVRHLTLVRPSAPPSTGAAVPSEEENQTESWRQLDMFAENPQTVVFVSPEKCKFADVVKLLLSAHIRQIFDMREMPHLVFEGQSRATFFDLLSKLNISYTSSLEFETRHEDKAPIVIARELAPKLKGGPTMVFSDHEPQSDPVVARIDENFTKEVKDYKSVYF